jgi:hypothetical protein
MRKQESILIVSLFLAASAAHGSEASCLQNGPIDRLLAGAAAFGQAASKKILASQDLLAMEERLAGLQAPGCRDAVWPRHKISFTPLRLISDESVFQFNHESGKLDFLRSANAADKRIQNYSFENPPAGDGGTVLNLDFYKPRERPRPPPPGAPIKKPACNDENRRLMDFLNENTPPRKGSRMDTAFEVLAHETFHNVDQNPKSPVHEHTGACKWHGGEMERAILGDTEGIQFYRQNAIAYLKRAFDAAPDSEERRNALLQVRAWMSKLARDFPEAAKKLKELDRVEGSAEYAGSMANTLGKLGCNASAQERRAALLDKVSDRYLPVTTPLDAQAYLLGAVAGFLMDEGGMSGWKERVAAGEAPIDLLLASGMTGKGKPVKAEADPLLVQSRAISQDISRCMQGVAEKAVAEVLAKPQDYMLVQMEETVYNSSGFFSVDTPEGPAIASPQTSSQGEKLTFFGAKMIRREGLCGGKQTNFVVVPRALIGDDGKIIGSDGSGFQGSVPPPASSRKAWNKVPVVCR